MATTHGNQRAVTASRGGRLGMGPLVNADSWLALNPVARELAPARLRSSRKPGYTVCLLNRVGRFGAASQPNGAVRRSDKPPHHKVFVFTGSRSIG
ncbi:hypothetical protein TMM008_36140 [Pseudomonas sp. 008]|nr:hypothetical protein TMM008_36140 [Pseudomonas sp. 008]